MKKYIYTGLIAILMFLFMAETPYVEHTLSAKTLEEENLNTKITDDKTAKELTATLSSSGGDSLNRLKDGSYHTAVSFKAGSTLTITAAESIYGIYLIWDTAPSAWTLSYGNISKQCGTNGFLHEYVTIPEGSDWCSITFSKDSSLCDIYIYGQGSIPKSVQVWEPSVDTADMLIFSTHADDEILFLGGPLVTYASNPDLKVQVVYMCEFYTTSKVREHEKLDGLWECGVNYYPVCGDFKDLYSTSLEAAKKQYNYDALVEFVTEQLRRFKPLIAVTQDVNGEYGHGGHIILVDAFLKSIDNCNNSTFCSESALKYGTWDVSKTYLHLYDNNTINIDVRKPIATLGNKTGLEVLTAAYKKHVSQQFCWFYVSDDYRYSCSAFGCYRSTVGYDTGNDMFENITTYKVQAEIEAQRIKESIDASIAESIRESEAISASIDESIKESEKAAQEAADEAKRNTLYLIGAIVVITAILSAIIIYLRKKHNNE